MNDLIFEDVNLDELKFSLDGRSVVVTFIDMVKGMPFGKVECKGVCACNYHNAFDSDEEALPSHVCEVLDMELEGNELETKMNRMGYGFLGRGVEMYKPLGNASHLLHIEGGEVSIDILCESVCVEKFEEVSF